jgi:hypothetical protein
MAYKIDIKDTLHRLRHVGKLIDLNEDSKFAKIVNGLLSLERGRLDEAVEATKKTLGDWAGGEIDTWWGTILSIQRLPGVETEEEYIGDATYLSRIKRFMEAGSKGISLETVRQAAEAGAGVPFKVNKAENRIILTPLEEMDAAQKAGAMRAVYRLGPARAIIEISSAETYGSERFTNLYSNSVYVGEDPSKIRLDGPHWDSDNMMIVAMADRWGPAEEGTLAPGSGVPNMLLRGGAWSVPNMGFGMKATLTIGTEDDEVINRVKFILGQGYWRVTCHVDEQFVFEEDITSYRWFEYDKSFNFLKGSSVVIKFENLEQDVRGLFVKGVYVGARVSQDNRVDWLALGGQEGANARNEVIMAETDSMYKGQEWIAQPAPDPSFQRELYAQVSGSPQRVSALSFKTRTPGALFRVSYSLDNLDNETNYPNLNWTDMPRYYKLVNGRVDVMPFRARHIKITFTNLRPLLLKEYVNES